MVAYPDQNLVKYARQILLGWDLQLVRMREAFRLWHMWTLTGWPSRRRCPQCAGSGKYATAIQARYGDAPQPCGMCEGAGLVKR